LLWLDTETGSECHHPPDCYARLPKPWSAVAPVVGCPDLNTTSRSWNRRHRPDPRNFRAGVGRDGLAHSPDRRRGRESGPPEPHLEGSRISETSELRAAGDPHYWPIPLPVAIVFVLLVLVVMVVQVALAAYAYGRLGLGALWAYATLLGSIIGSRFNIPLTHLRGSTTYEAVVVRA
jgi:hypothetical protein